jgi:hypothetical protein
MDETLLWFGVGPILEVDRVHRVYVETLCTLPAGKTYAAWHPEPLRQYRDFLRTRFAGGVSSAIGVFVNREAGATSQTQEQSLRFCGERFPN